MQIGMAFVNYYVKIYVSVAALGTVFDLAQIGIAQMQIRPKRSSSASYAYYFETYLISTCDYSEDLPLIPSYPCGLPFFFFPKLIIETVLQDTE